MPFILTVAALSNGHLAQPALETLGAALALSAKLNPAQPASKSVASAVIGAPGAVVAAARELGRRGAGRVLAVEHEALADYQAELYLEAAQAVCRAAEPDVILFPADGAGRDLAPRLAARLGGGLVTDCTGLDVDGDGATILMTKPVYGGKAVAVLATPRRPQMATIRPRTMEVPPPLWETDQTGATGVSASEAAVSAESAAAGPASADFALEYIAFSPDLGQRATRLVERLQEKVDGVKLEDARIVISGGRGIGGPEGFKELEALAATIGAAVGASRAAVDAGWVPANLQVGLTGKMIGPDLYIAVGISGAMQHMAGVSSAKHIVAINTDPDAPIFSLAEFGVVADYKAVLPTLTAKLKEVVGT